jgi:predicted metal-dependent hydrolase
VSALRFDRSSRPVAAVRAELRFGNTRIPYSILRGPRRRRTLAISVDLAEGVQVRAPLDTPLERIEELVRRRARWILERRRRFDALPGGQRAREFVSGETFRYLGRQYRLAVERSPATPAAGAVLKGTLRGPACNERRVRLLGGHLVVPHPPGAHDPELVRSRLTAWYRAHAEERLPERVAHWANRLGLEPTAILVRDQRKRWGSADAKGTVRLNWRIVQAPIRLVDYVAVHELVHLRHPGHTRHFWAALGEVLPDYEQDRERLRLLGGELLW